MVMEAKKSHRLLSASWRPRKVSGVIQSESKALRIGAQWSDGAHKSWFDARTH